VASATDSPILGIVNSNIDSQVVRQIYIKSSR